MEDVNRTVAALRAERRKAIESYQFKRAKEIEMELKYLKEKTKVDKGAETTARNIEEFEREKGALKARASEKRGIFTKKLIQLRANYQGGMAQMSEKHAGEIQGLMNSYGMDMELEAMRCNPEARHMFRISKLLAHMSCYERAEQLFGEGVETEQAAVQQKQLELNDSYSTKQTKLMEQHMKEVDGHSAKLENEIDMLCLQYEKELNELKQAYRVHAIKYRRPWSDEEIEQFFRPYALVDDDDNGAILESPAKRTPKKAPSPKTSPPSPHSYQHVGSVSNVSGLMVGRSPSKMKASPGSRTPKKHESPRTKGHRTSEVSDL